MATVQPLSKGKLLQAHIASGSSNTTNYCNDELINALGGIRNVLTMILSSEDIKLNDQQLVKINQIINAAASSQSDAIQSDIEQIHESESAQEWTYCFDKTNTYLHGIFGQDNGQKIFDFIYSKRCFILVSLLALFGFIFEQILLSLNMLLTNVIIMQITLVLLIPYLLFVLLSVNKRCFKLVIQSFDFWIKLFYFLQFRIAYMVYYYALTDPEQWVRYQMESGSIAYKLEIFLDSLRAVAFLLVVLLIISVDALQIKSWQKISGCVAAGVLFSFIAISYTFYTDIWGNDNSIIHIKSLDLSISASSMMASSLQILSIFVWKQVLLSIFKRNRCILIRYSPYIKWENQIQVGNATGAISGTNVAQMSELFKSKKKEDEEKMDLQNDSVNEMSEMESYLEDNDEEP